MRLRRSTPWLVSLGVVLISPSLWAEWKTVPRIVTQPASPVAITSFNTSQYTADTITHVLQYQNRSGRDIVAVQFGIASFDVWNEFMDHRRATATTTLQPGKGARGVWGAHWFHVGVSLMTGVAYVRRVRFADGEIWTAGQSEVLAEVRQIKKDFDPALLSREDQSPK